MMVEVIAHSHYYYTFGTVVSTRKKELVSKEEARSCQTHDEMILVGNGKNFCCFVAMAKTTYPASSPSKYLIPKVTSIETDSVVPVVKEIIKESAIKSLLNHQFEIYGECNTEQETQSKPKRVKLASEVAINELTCEGLKCFIKNTLTNVLTKYNSLMVFNKGIEFL